MVGEMALLSPGAAAQRHGAALEPTEALAVDAARFAAVREQQPAWPRCWSSSSWRGCATSTSACWRHSTFLPTVRLLRRVLELADHYGDRIPLTQDDLAALAGGTRRR